MPMPYSLHVSAFWSYAIVNDLKWQQWQQWQHFQGEVFQKGNLKPSGYGGCLKASGVGTRNMTVAGSTSKQMSE